MEEAAMTSRHLIDPELVAALDQFPGLQFTEESLPQIRALGEEMWAQQAALLPAFPDIEVAGRGVPGPAGAPDVRVLVYVPKSAPRPLPALLWIHGGGYIIGSANQDDVQV